MVCSVCQSRVMWCNWVASLPLLAAATVASTAHESGTGGGAAQRLAVEPTGASRQLIRKEVSIEAAALLRSAVEVPPASLLHVEQRNGAHQGASALAAGQQARFQVNASTSWAQLASWVSGNGGFLESTGLRTTTTHHAETLIRGMVSTKPLSASQMLLHVPQKMWLHVDNYPDVADVRLLDLPECIGKSRPSTDLIKLAMVVALELNKGPSSWYARYLRQLPTMAYYRTFHLHYATDEILSSFMALPLTPLVRHLQKNDQELKSCFEAWQRNSYKVGGPLNLAALKWDQVELALMHARTRAVNVGKGRRFAIVPGLDFFNTGEASTRNLHWSVSGVGDAIDVSAAGAVEQGAELLDTYCEDCDNSRLLLLWGVTLDANKNSLDPSANRAFCSTSPAGSAGSSDTAVALKDLVASLLDVGGDSQRPQCLALKKPPKEAAKMQAPLRCSLALLALEYCAATWAAEAKMEQESDLGGSAQLAEKDSTAGAQEMLFSGMTLREAADTVYASAIGAVHPFLLKST